MLPCTDESSITQANESELVTQRAQHAFDPVSLLLTSFKHVATSLPLNHHFVLLTLQGLQNIGSRLYSTSCCKLLRQASMKWQRSMHSMCTQFQKPVQPLQGSRRKAASYGS